MATILYIDDEDINLKLFEINFRKQNQVYLAISGVQGMEIIEEQPSISIVFCDLKMPFMDGIEFCRKAKAIRPEIPFYLMTGYAITEEIQNVIDEGIIENYLNKPFVLSELLNAIKSSEHEENS